MPEPLPDLENADTLLPTVLQHLPNVNSNPDLANVVFTVVTQAHRRHDPHHFIIPLLPSLTAVALMAPPSLFPLAANVIVTLTRSLVGRRLVSHVSSYLAELVSLTRRLLESSTCDSLPFTLPSFPSKTVFLLPLTPSTVYAAFALLAVHIPSELALPSSLPISVNSSPVKSAPVTASALPCASSIRLWHSISSYSRSAVLNLAARCEILSERVGPLVARIAVHLLRRAFNPTCSALVPVSLRNRIIHVVEDAFPYSSEPSELLRLVAIICPHRRISASVWAHRALAHGLQRSPAGDTARSFLRAGRVVLSSVVSHSSRTSGVPLIGRPCHSEQLNNNSHVNANLDGSSLTPENSPDSAIQQAFSLFSGSDSGFRSSSAALQSYKQPLTLPQDGIRPSKNTSDDSRLKRPISHLEVKSEQVETDSADLHSRKRLRVDLESGTDLNEVVSIGSGPHKLQPPNLRGGVESDKDCPKRALSPSNFLRKAFSSRSNIQRCAETPSSLHMLANAAFITADTLRILTLSEPTSPHAVIFERTEWYKFSLSLACTLRDVSGAFLRNLNPLMWPAVLAMACACIRLEDAIGLTRKEDSDATLQIRDTCRALQQVVVSVLSAASATLQSAPESVPIRKFSALLQRIGDYGLRSQSYHKNPDLMKAIFVLSQYSLDLPDVLQKSTQAALLKGVFRARIAAGPVDSATGSDTLETCTRLLRVIEDNLKIAPELSAAALHALSIEVCCSRECYVSHELWYLQEHVASASVRDDLGNFVPLFKFILQTIRSVDNDAVSIGAVRCLSVCLVHCLPAQRVEFFRILIDFLWTAKEPAILQTVVSTLSYSLAREKREHGKASEAREASGFDGLENGDENILLSNLLKSELESHVERSDLFRNGSKGILDRTIQHDLRPIACYILFTIYSFDPSCLSNLLHFALLSTCALEVNSLSPVSATSQSSGLSGNHSSDASIMALCGDAVFSALMVQERDERTRILNQIPAFSNLRSTLNPCQGMFCSSFSITQIVASVFTTHIKKWLPLCLPRMFEDDTFVVYLVKVLSERDVRSFWEKVPRHVMTTLILGKDTASIDLLASKLGKSKPELIENTLADSFAAMLMKPSASMDQDSLIFQVLKRPMIEVVRGRVGGKVVQRLIMELGGNDDGKAKSALARFAKLLSVGKAVSADTDSISGSLVQTHFMLVMDAVNRCLFQSRASEVEQLRHLRMLHAVISISKNYLHVFVPKILATLKLAIDTFSGNHRVFVSTLHVWSSFLNTLGSTRIVAHAASILAIIIPFLGQLENVLCSNLSSLIEQSASHNYTDRSLVVLLLRIADREPLRKAANILECAGELSEVRPSGSSSEKGPEHNVTNMQMAGIERTCRDVSKIISKHGNGKIEVMAARYFFLLLRVNREEVNRARLARNTAGIVEGDSNRDIARLANVMRLLVKQLTVTPNTDCQRVIMQCIGEIGAVDPGIISQNVVELSPPNGIRKSARIQSYPTNVHALVALLLDDFLVPTLGRGEVHSDSTNRQNRIGLVIQELLRVTGCKRNTAMRASRTSRVRTPADEPIQWNRILIGETTEENAIYFWENLLGSTREVIEPYLSEPFDVQLYKGVFGGDSAGNERLSCQPVWLKIKAAASVGVIANAQEWRRQVIVQLVDFIGKQGMFGEVLRALRPVLRYEDGLAAYIFPLVITTVLDAQQDKTNSVLKDFLIKEIADVLQEASSPEVIFDLFDVLRHWREERCVVKAHEFANSPNGPLAKGGGSVPANKLRVALPKFAEIAKGCDPISSFVDLHGHVSPSLSLLTQAKCAFRTRSYARAILLAENHVRQIRIKNDLHTWPACLESVLGKTSLTGPNNDGDAEACSILQKSFAGLDDADSMSGIAALRTSSSLAELVIDTEVSGRFNEALSTYERAIAENPQNVQFHQGFLRCLMSLGHWETMLSHAKGLLHSAKLNEMELRKTAEANGIEAAWRLGRWDSIKMFDNFPVGKYENAVSIEPVNKWDLDYTISFGKMIFALHDRNEVLMRSAANAAREHILLPLRRAALDGYNRAYPMIVRLHSVSDVEDVYDELSTRESIKCEESGDSLQDSLRARLRTLQYPRLHSMATRTTITSASIKIREPLLSTKRVCFEELRMLNEATRVNVQLARLAKDAENLRSAAASAFRALSTKCDDEDVKNSLVVETAQIQRAQGDSSGALIIVKREIDRLFKVLHDQREQKASADTITATSDRLCTAHVLAGSWIANNRSEPSDVVLNYFQQATQYGPSREEPFYALGKHYDSLLQASINVDEDLATSGDLSQGRTIRRVTPVEAHVPEHSSRYVPHVIKSYARALKNGSSRIFEALPRMLTVWFDYYTGLDDGKEGWKGINIEGKVRDVVRLAFDSIPVYMWMTAVPQLMSRILHNRKIVQDELANILARIIVHFPDESVWTVLPSTQLKSSLQRRKATTGILNLAIAESKRDRKTGYRERSKALRTRLLNCMAILGCFVGICESPGSKDRRGRMDNCNKEFKTLRSNLESNSAPNPMVPTLKSLTVRLPTTNAGGLEHRPFDSEVVRIEEIDDQVMVMSSLMCPRRISLIGSDGKHYRYLAKRENNGDMRRDSRVVEFLTVMNQLLSKEAETSGKDLRLKSYAVLPLTEETGMIEWVNDLCAFRTLVGQEHARLQKIPSQMVIKQKYESNSDKKLFLEWACDQFPAKLDEYFVRQFGGGDAQAWLAARNEWTRSSAVWSMSGYIVGLGDRHGENVLIETTSGRCVHVDFAMLFDKGQKLRVPEVVPFRLTQNMVCVMGIAGYEGTFRIVCERVMRLVRDNSDALLSRLESFLYDPLADWAGSETHGAKAGVMATREAWQARAMVKAKLTGMVDNSGLALSIEGQVERLIREASSKENLGRMYIWWGPWI